MSRASPAVCDPVKVFFTSKFCYLLISNHTHKTKTEIANRWKTTNNKPPGPIKNREQESDHIYLHSSLGTVRLSFAFHQSQQNVQKSMGQNHFAELNQPFFSSKFNLQAHILNTAGDALIMDVI